MSVDGSQETLEGSANGAVESHEESGDAPLVDPFVLSSKIEQTLVPLAQEVGPSNINLNPVYNTAATLPGPSASDASAQQLSLAGD
jgi:hypothetical protein